MESYEMAYNEPSGRWRIWRVTHELVAENLTLARGAKLLQEMRAKHRLDPRGSVHPPFSIAAGIEEPGGVCDNAPGSWTTTCMEVVDTVNDTASVNHPAETSAE